VAVDTGTTVEVVYLVRVDSFVFVVVISVDPGTGVPGIVGLNVETSVAAGLV